MSDGFGGLQDLYGEVILDHNRKPRNFGRLPAASHSAVGYNPLCGDRVEITARVEDGRIEEIAFEGVGCAISTASASMMTEALRGKSLAEARRLFERFHALVTGASTGGDGAGEVPEMGKLAAFAGVGEFPMRVKCATLAWHALQSALASGEASPPPAEGAAPGAAAGREAELAVGQESEPAAGPEPAPGAGSAPGARRGASHHGTTGGR